MPIDERNGAFATEDDAFKFSNAVSSRLLELGLYKPGYGSRMTSGLHHWDPVQTCLKCWIGWKYMPENDIRMLVDCQNTLLIRASHGYMVALKEFCEIAQH